MNTITAVQFGVGPIGQRIVTTASQHNIEFVGAVDIDPAKVGNELGAVLDTDVAAEAIITDDPDEALATEPDVVFHATTSSFETVEPQLKQCLGAGTDVISTTEELVYPWVTQPELADDLDRHAVTAGQSVLGTGINPGFAMDLRPVMLSTACQTVSAVRVTRVQDAASRREPLREKIGVGRTVEAFESEIAAEAGHVGLRESADMLAAGLGWELDAFEETIEPVVATNAISTDNVDVESGRVAGIHQTASGTVGGDERIVLDLEMSVGADSPRDRVRLRGEPDVEAVVDGGLHGDVTTPAIVVNMTRPVHQAKPGLQTMLDLPPGGCRTSLP